MASTCLPSKLLMPNAVTHGDMGWGWASYGCYPKVTTRSSQVHSKVKSDEIGENSSFLLQFCSLNEISVMVQIHL